MPRLDTLWYEIDARTKDFDENIVGAKRKLQDFTDYAGKHPGIVLGALGVAFAAVAYEATKMAAEIDKSMRQLKSVMPGATADIKALREEIVQLSLSTPKTQKELADTAVEIAKMGVTGPEELKQRLRAVAEMSEATSLDMKTVSEGLNTIGDAFQLSGKKATDAMKEIFAISQGKVPLEEVFSALQRGGSVLASLSVSARDAAQAMATLRDAGVFPRKVGTSVLAILELADKATGEVSKEQDPVKRAELEKYLAIVTKTNIATHGLIPVIKQLSEAFGNQEANLRHLGLSADATNAVLKIHDKVVTDARTSTEQLADAEKAVAAAAYENSNSTQALSEKIHNNLNASLIELGIKILPVVNAAFQTMLDMMNDGVRDANALADAMKRIQAGKPQEAATTGQATGEARFLNYRAKVGPDGMITGQSTPQGDVERSAYAAQQFGVKAVFGGETSTQQEQSLKYLRTLTTDADDARFGVRATILVLAGLIEDTKKAEQATQNLSDTEKAAALKKIADNDKIRKDQLAADTARALAKATEPKLQALGAEMRALLAGETPSKTQSEMSKIDDILKKWAEIKKDGGIIPQSQINDYIKLLAHVDVTRTEEAAKAKARFDELLSTATTSIADNLTAALEKLKEELGTMPGFTEKMLAQVVAAQQLVIKAHRDIEALPGIGVVNDTDPTQMMTEMRKLTDRKQALTDLESAAVGASKERADITAEIAKNEAEIVKLQKEGMDYEANILKIATERLRKLTEIAAAIQNTVALALDLAQAFGMINSSTVQILSSLSAVMSKVPQMITAVEAFHAGTGSMLSAFGASAAVVGGISDVVLGLVNAQDAVDKERNRLMGENNIALRNLSQNIGDLGRIMVTGTEYTKVQKFLDDPKLATLKTLKETNSLYGGYSYDKGADRQNRQIGDVLTAMGMSAQELKDFAKQFGVTVGTGAGGKILIEDLRALKKAMADSEWTQFAQTFTGQMNQMNATISLFNLDKPIQQFKEFQKSIDRIAGTGKLSSILKDMDLTTSTGIRAAEKMLQDLFDKMQAGSLTATELGGMTPQEFMDALLKADSILKAQGASPGLGGSGGFNVQQTITQVTGERMSALMSTANVFAEMTAKNTGMIVAAMGGVASLPSISAPSVTPAAATSGGGSSGAVHIGNMPITVNFPGGLADVSVAQKVGAAIGAATMDAIDKEMAARYRWNLRARGVGSAR